MKQHSLDKSGSAYQIGLEAEARFIMYMLKRGWEVHQSTNEQDTKDHVDFIISKNDLELKVDVKAQKRISRQDADTQNDLIWIEFRNGAGHLGWIYGQADLIAFQDGEEFVLVWRLQLAEAVEKITKKEFAQFPTDALNKLYRRRGRKDLLTLVKFELIKDIEAKL